MKTFTQSFYATILSTILLSSTAQATETDVGNGGHGIRCQDGKLYALDYVLTLNSKGQDEVLPSFKTASDALNILSQMAEILENKVPTLGKELKWFIHWRNNTKDWTQEKIWLDGDGELKALGDEWIIRDLQKYCKPQVDANKKVMTNQAIIRSKPSKTVIFYYDEADLSELEKNSPVQLSYLYTHEFLRDYTQDPRIIMLVNALLHSQQILSLNEEQMVQSLENLGLPRFKTKTQMERENNPPKAHKKIILEEGSYKPFNGNYLRTDMIVDHKEGYLHEIEGGNSYYYKCEDMLEDQVGPHLINKSECTHIDDDIKIVIQVLSPNTYVKQVYQDYRHLRSIFYWGTDSNHAWGHIENGQEVYHNRRILKGGYVSSDERYRLSLDYLSLEKTMIMVEGGYVFTLTCVINEDNKLSCLDESSYESMRPEITQLDNSRLLLAYRNASGQTYYQGVFRWKQWNGSRL